MQLIEQFIPYLEPPLESEAAVQKNPSNSALDMYKAVKKLKSKLKSTSLRHATKIYTAPKQAAVNTQFRNLPEFKMERSRNGIKDEVQVLAMCNKSL